MDSLEKSWNEITYLSGELAADLAKAALAIIEGTPLELKTSDLPRTTYRDEPGFLSRQEPFPMQVLCILSLLFLTMHWTYRILMVKPGSRWILTYVRGSPPSEQLIQRMTQAHCEMVTYSIFSVVGLLLLSREAWCLSMFENFENSIYMWTGMPDNTILSPGLKLFYISYCARYIQAFISVFMEPRKKDFIEMQVHHVTTIILVSISYYSGRVRVGLAIMVLMDLADPMFHFGKQLNYIKDETNNIALKNFLEYVTNGMLAFFVFWFGATRVVAYPYLWYSDVTDPIRLKKGHFKLEYLKDEHWTALIENSFLGVLMILQVIWFYMLLSAVKRFMGGAILEDTRSEASLEENEEDKKDK